MAHVKADGARRSPAEVLSQLELQQDSSSGQFQMARCHGLANPPCNHSSEEDGHCCTVVVVVVRRSFGWLHQAVGYVARPCCTIQLLDV